jgi:protein-disulfide isomerase
VDDYIAANPDQAGRGSGVRDRLKVYLSQRALIERRIDYLASLRERADYRFLAKAPERPRIKVETAGAPWRGSAQAPIVLVHFANFPSRLCVESAGKIRRVMEEFPGQVRWVHLDFFSIQDPDALYAAEMGQAAFEQGMFWEYHDRMMGLQGRVSREAVNGAAEALTIDRKRFEAAQREGKYLLRVKEEIGYGVRIGIQAAPVIFVNGIYFSGTFPYGELKSLVERELKK